MGRTAKRRREPALPKVERIELDEKHIPLRIVLFVICLAIGVSCLAFAFHSLISTEPGWSEIEVNTAAELSCAEDFILTYRLGAGEMSATAENRAIKTLYSEAVVTAFRLFSSDTGFEGVNNIYTLNTHPNEDVTLDPALYKALETFERSGERCCYLAPAYACYDDVFFCTDDSQTYDFDPTQNDSLRAFFADIARYASDSAAVRLELLGSNTARLCVSQDYLDFAEREGIDRFFDFVWLKNAFIADYLAERLSSAGYTLGSLTSFDGYTRNLDDSGESYSYNIYDRDGAQVRRAAIMEYTGSIAIANFRSYPLNGADSRRYYVFSDGSALTPYLGSDAMPKCSCQNLTALSRGSGCAELALSLTPLFTGDNLSADALEALGDVGIYPIWFEGRTLRSLAPDVTFAELYDADGVKYVLG